MRTALLLLYKTGVGKCQEVMCSVGCEVQFVKLTELKASMLEMFQKFS